jgi:hypothetical protein
LAINGFDNKQTVLAFVDLVRVVVADSFAMVVRGNASRFDVRVFVGDEIGFAKLRLVRISSACLFASNRTSHLRQRDSLALHRLDSIHNFYKK